MHHIKAHISDILAIISGGSAITAWQEQLDWTLRIVASLVAIAAAVYSISHRSKKLNANPEQPDDQ